VIYFWYAIYIAAMLAMSIVFRRVLGQRPLRLMLTFAVAIMKGRVSIATRETFVKSVLKWDEYLATTGSFLSLLNRWVRGRQISALSILDAWAAVLPARIVNEDLGDYIDDISRRKAAGQRFLVCLRVVAAMFWTGFNTLGYVLKKLRRRSGA